MYEDELFYLQAFFRKNFSLYVRDEVFFYRRLRLGSVMTTPRSNFNFESNQSIFEEMLVFDFVGVKGVRCLLLKRFLRRVVRDAVHVDGLFVEFRKIRVIARNIMATLLAGCS